MKSNEEIIETRRSSSDQGLEPLLTQRELATLLGVSERHIANLRHDQSFPAAIHIGRSVRFRRDDIRKWLQGNTEK